MTTREREVWISVDIETDGPAPGKYSMLSLGACLVHDPPSTFYRELRPISESGKPETVLWLKKHGLDRDKLLTSGVEPLDAMRDFNSWISLATGFDATPVFVAFNATFDWMFVQWYFTTFLDAEPFGHSALDIKAFYMALMRKKTWSETSLAKIEKRFIPKEPHTHHALEDAIQQAALFRNILKEAYG